MYLVIPTSPYVMMEMEKALDMLWSPISMPI